MKYSLYVIIVIFALSFPIKGQTQSSAISIAFESLEIDELGGLQSFAFGQYNGKWLLVGGRLDGLHRRQPWASFDIDGHNDQLIVVDPTTSESWSAPLTSLPESMQEQLRSTNMEFYQNDDHLYIIGGYGYSHIEEDHTTYPYLTAISVSETIDAIINGSDFSSFCRQLSDPLFQVTGGRLQKIEDVFYLVGGQVFLGRYNPMGPDHGPGFFQEYTNAIRKFQIFDNGDNLSVNHLPSYQDTIVLHRRDFNVVSQIMPDGQEGITAFSGVFQHDVDLPFLNAVNITETGYELNETFTQYYNHYHCANLPMYSASENKMHNLFFGGIAQYYDLDGQLVQDNNVPFVKTIANVTRAADNQMMESKLSAEMPGFLGAGSEFIISPNMPIYENEVLRFDDLTNDTTLVGYIFGGINSTEENIFWINDGTQSIASAQILKVYLIKNSTTGIPELNNHSVGTLKLSVFPNPFGEEFRVKYNLTQPSKVHVTIHNLKGKKIEDIWINDARIGENEFEKRIRKMYKGGVYILKVETNYEQATQRIIVDP